MWCWVNFLLVFIAFHPSQSSNAIHKRILQNLCFRNYLKRPIKSKQVWTAVSIEEVDMRKLDVLLLSHGMVVFLIFRVCYIFSWNGHVLHNESHFRRLVINGAWTDHCLQKMYFRIFHQIWNHLIEPGNEFVSYESWWCYSHSECGYLMFMTIQVVMKGIRFIAFFGLK